MSTLPQLQVAVPPGVSAGQMMQVNGPGGQAMMVAVPAGLGPGDIFAVNFPASSAPPPPGTWQSLYKRVPEDGVTSEFKKLAKSWPVWSSDEAEPMQKGTNRFHFHYNGDYDSERVLITKGKATMTPDDGSPSLALVAGDAAHFHFGLAATWEVHEPLTMSYGYFGRDGEELKQDELHCDVCGAECYEESYLFNDETDICPTCYRADMNGAE